MPHIPLTYLWFLLQLWWSFMCTKRFFNGFSYSASMASRAGCDHLQDQHERVGEFMSLGTTPNHWGQMPQPPILWSNISTSYSGLFRSAGRIKTWLPRTANSIIDPYALGFASFLASFFLLGSCPKGAICTQVLCSGSTFRETHSKESIFEEFHFLLSKETETQSNNHTGNKWWRHNGKLKAMPLCRTIPNNL